MVSYTEILHHLAASSTQPWSYSLTAFIETYLYVVFMDATGTADKCLLKPMLFGEIPYIETFRVTNMKNWFCNRANFNDDISAWDVSNVRNMSFMFYRCSSFNRPLSTWNTSAVTEMIHMFSYCPLFNEDISGWNVSAVTYMSGMFVGCSSFNTSLNSWKPHAGCRIEHIFCLSGLHGKGESIGGIATRKVCVQCEMWRSGAFWLSN